MYRYDEFDQEFVNGRVAQFRGFSLQLQTSNPFPSINSETGKMVANADGSIDIYFGPEAPKGKENNWIETVPNKSWFPILRLYGPLEPWFDKTWKPGEV